MAQTWTRPLSVGLCAAVIACSPQMGEIDGGNGRSPGAGDSILSGGEPGSARDSLHVDREEMLSPDPRLRAWHRLYAFRYWIGNYERRHGRLPDRIEQFAPPREAGSTCFMIRGATQHATSGRETITRFDPSDRTACPTLPTT